MSPTTQNIYNQLTNAMNSYQNTPALSQGAFSNNVMQQVGNMKPQYQELANADSKLYTAPADNMQQFYQQYGTGANSGIAPMSMLQNLMSRIGTQQGTRDVLANSINTAGGNLKDIANNAYQAYQGDLNKQGNLIQTLQGLYGTSSQNDQAAANRALQQQQLDWEKQQAQLNLNNINNQNKIVEMYVPDTVSGTPDQINAQLKQLQTLGAIPIDQYHYRLPLSNRIVTVTGADGYVPSNKIDQLSPAQVDQMRASLMPPTSNGGNMAQGKDLWGLLGDLGKGMLGGFGFSS